MGKPNRDNDTLIQRLEERAQASEYKPELDRLPHRGIERKAAAMLRELEAKAEGSA